MLYHHKHDSVRREVLAALDAEMAKLRELIKNTDALIISMNERNRQLEALHELRHAQLDLIGHETDDSPITYKNHQVCGI